MIAVAIKPQTELRHASLTELIEKPTPSLVNIRGVLHGAESATQSNQGYVIRSMTLRDEMGNTMKIVALGDIALSDRLKDGNNVAPFLCLLPKFEEFFSARMSLAL